MRTWFFRTVTRYTKFSLAISILKEQIFVIEPGFYQDGEFGIRIENLVKVVSAKPENNFKDRKFCTFENLTFVPIQKKM